MNRRKFLQLLGLSGAAAAASTVAAKGGTAIPDDPTFKPAPTGDLSDTVWDISPAETPFIDFGRKSAGQHGLVNLYWRKPAYADVKQFDLYVDRGDGFQIEMEIPPHHNALRISDNPKVQRVMMTWIDHRGIPRDVHLDGDICP